MRFFLSGVIQGSVRDDGITDQLYREKLLGILRTAFPDPEHVTLCPIEMYPYSTGLPDDIAKRAFEHLVETAASADAIVAYLPVASNGTAIEIWEASKRGTPVFTISPMSANWVIKFYSTRVFATIEAFADFVASGELLAFMQPRLQSQGAFGDNLAEAEIDIAVV